MAITVKGLTREGLSNVSVCRTTKLLALLGVLAVSVCYVKEVSYAGSSAVSTYHLASGNATDVVVAKTGDILVSISNSEEKLVGIQIFSPALDFASPCIIRLDAPIVSAQGVVRFPDRTLQRRSTKQSIGVAVEDSGVAFLRADLSTCAKESIVVAQKPVQPPPPCGGKDQPKCSPGTFDLAVTPNSKLEYAFVANEYGATKPASKNDNLGGTVGIIRIVRDPMGKFRPGTRPIRANAYIYIPGADTIPGVTISKDGKYLYVVNENAKSGTYPKGSRYYNNPYNNPTGISNADLVTDSCVNEYGKNDNKANNGVLTIIDVNKAIYGGGQRSIIQTIASGCSPVRVVETADGQNIFVATRGGNPEDPDCTTAPAGSVGRILVFDVSKLRSRDLDTANEALVNVIKDSGGTAPVGLALFDRDQRLAVANSNRFTKGATGMTSVAIFDVGDPSAVTGPEVVCPSSNIFDFPRGVTTHGSKVYVANFGTDTEEGEVVVKVPGKLQVITIVEDEDSTSGCTVEP